MRIEVDASLDDVLDGCFAIIATDEEHGSWVAYVPGETPCICDTLKDAVSVLRAGMKGRNEWPLT